MYVPIKVFKTLSKGRNVSPTFQDTYQRSKFLSQVLFSSNVLRHDSRFLFVSNASRHVAFQRSKWRVPQTFWDMYQGCELTFSVYKFEALLGNRLMNLCLQRLETDVLKGSKCIILCPINCFEKRLKGLCRGILLLFYLHCSQPPLFLFLFRRD